MRKQKNEQPKRLTSPGTIIGLVLLIGLGVFLLMIIAPGQAGEFNGYRGPILPLSSLSGAEKLTVERDVVLDFSSYAEVKRYDGWSNRLAVTDSYRLTNPADTTVTAELVWGFQGQFTDPMAEIPAITVDGQPVQGRLYAASGVDADKVRNSGSFRGYKKLIEQQNYLENAMAPTPEWEMPVKVYHFYNLLYEGGEILGAPHLRVDFEQPDDTNVWTRTFHASLPEDGTQRILFELDDGEAWLYVMGEDITELKVSGNRGYDITENSALEGVQYELETYESTFMECLRESAAVYEHYDDAEALELLTPELLYDMAVKLVADPEYQILSRAMDSLFYTVCSDTRMIYWVFPVEVPAGDTVTVSGSYLQQGSYNTMGLLNGYDVATTLGSNLHFTKQSATIQNEDFVILAPEEQNFGFDPANGVRTVELDPETGRYFVGIIPIVEE